MSVFKKSIKMFPNPFLANHSKTSTVYRSSPKMWAIFVIFKKLPKVSTHTMGENSPNGVTLIRFIVSM
jgi:hypothetical protein